MQPAAPCPTRSPRQHAGAQGFTLIELLVALAVLALMAGLGWRGIDGMLQAQERVRAKTDAVLALQAGLTQWGVDLDAMVQLPNVPALEWDGRALRITRRHGAAPADGVLVVAWSRRADGIQGRWLRWQSEPLRTRGEWETAWLRAEQWAQNPDDLQRRQEVALSPLDTWTVFYYRSDAWTNPLSSSGEANAQGAAQAAAALPDGVRLVMTLPPGAGPSGTIVRDWVRPTLGHARS